MTRSMIGVDVSKDSLDAHARTVGSPGTELEFAL